MAGYASAPVRFTTGAALTVSAGLTVSERLTVSAGPAVAEGLTVTVTAHDVTTAAPDLPRLAAALRERCRVDADRAAAGAADAAAVAAAANDRAGVRAALGGTGQWGMAVAQQIGMGRLVQRLHGADDA